MLKIISVMIFVLSLSACGINENLEKTNEQIQGMNGRIKKMSDNLDNMNGSIGGMNTSLSATAKGIHSQSLMIALNEMLKPENTKYITLVSANPLPMVASAKGFGEIATSSELAGLAFIYLAEINLCQVDDILTKEQRNAFDLGKYVKLNGLGLIAALAPQDKVDALVREQIIDGGEYRDAALSFITLRNLFIRTYLVDQELSSSHITKGQYDAIKASLDSLSIIQSYPFFKELTLKLYDFYQKDLNQIITVDKLNMDEYYKKLETLKKK